MYDFVVDEDDDNQFFAYPASNLGRVWFDTHCAEWDLSERGIELSTTYSAFDSFLEIARGEGMRVIVNA